MQSYKQRNTTQAGRQGQGQRMRHTVKEKHRKRERGTAIKPCSTSTVIGRNYRDESYISWLEGRPGGAQCISPEYSMLAMFESLLLCLDSTAPFLCAGSCSLCLPECAPMRCRSTIVIDRLGLFPAVGA